MNKPTDRAIAHAFREVPTSVVWNEFTAADFVVKVAERAKEIDAATPDYSTLGDLCSLRGIVAQMRNFADVADHCTITEVVNAIPSIRTWADMIEQKIAAAPAGAQGAVGEVIVYDSYRGARLFDAENCWLPEGTKLYTHPPAASEIEQLSESEKDVALAQAVTFAEYVERQAKGAMVDAAKRFLSLPYSKELAERLAASEDAERLDWIECNPSMFCKCGGLWFTSTNNPPQMHQANSLRAAIDAARDGEGVG